MVEGRQGYFAMDDFSYNVLEPGTYGLLLAALGGLALTARRRKSQD